MSIYFDTEFIEDGRTIDLISIGMVREDGATYYAISTEFDASKASDWVKENVLKCLPPKIEIAGFAPNDPYLLPDINLASLAWKSRAEIANDIINFVGDSPIFYGYYSACDWVTLYQLYDTMMDLPKGWPFYCRDLQQLADDWGVKLSEVVPQENEHYALADALWNKKAHEYLIVCAGL